MTISGDFEIHLTAMSGQADHLAAYAAEHGLKFVHIELDRGATRSQPMLTLTSSGTLTEVRQTAADWHLRLQRAGIYAYRTKIEAAPWCTGVPQTAEEAARQPRDRYFEHHVKILLPRATVVPDLIALAAVVEPHGARVSRNARRRDADGAEQRFVTQRCHSVGLPAAQQSLDALVAGLRTAGYQILSVEQEYVVLDNHLSLDHGWLTPPHHEPWPERDQEQEQRRRKPGWPGYPVTSQSLPPAPGITQTAAFDPALKHWSAAYRAGEPVFQDAEMGDRWRTARRAAMNHLLGLIAESRWREHLVLRGSVTMAAWFGAAAREPGDLDFVVVPPSVTSDGAEARELLDGLRSAVRYSPGAGLQPDRTTESAIWTYERADGRRLAIPFQVPGAPPGSVQIDIVFGEHLPLPPAPISLPGVRGSLTAATAELSLAWKLQWLATDMYPQGKDLYDATLLAEHTTVDLALVRDLIRPDLRAEADTFTAATVLTWVPDWPNFTDEYPAINTTLSHWQSRLALALHTAWS